MNKINQLLILDLDETLIYASENELPLSADFIFDKYFVYKRPHLEKFLINIAPYFSLGIWSSADDIYVEQIVKNVMPNTIAPEFVWGRSKCSKRLNPLYETFYFEKRLDKLKKKGFSLDNIIIVDDTPEKSRTNYGNAISIKPFGG